MTEELTHLTEEQRKQVLEIFPKEIKDLEATTKDDTTPEQKDDIRKGYTDYEKKTKESDRLTFGEDEIEMTEEDLN